MSILIGLIPALAWGVMPLFVRKIGGKPTNQILGTTAGTLLAAICVQLYMHPHIPERAFFLALLSGALWVVGQVGQYTAFNSMGVSRTMPLSTGLQLIGTTLIGVLVFHEWRGTRAEVIGFSALALVIVGIYLTTMKGKGSEGGVNKGALIMLVLTSFGYLAYSSIPEVVGAKGTEIFLPYAFGMLLAALIYIVATRHTSALKEKTSWKNMIPGLLFAVASLTYIISAEKNGIATGFVLSQLSVVISTLGGILILKEKKTRFELIATIIGLILIVVGASATAMMRH
ncbi:MAG: GRP family sugar transporter [Planctomycetaceae bacterium]|nr:GRP family sugar transporter [Planctomycetaceae bacterium]